MAELGRRRDSSQELRQLVAHGNDVRMVAFGHPEVNRLFLEVDILPLQSFNAAFAGAGEQGGDPPHALNRPEILTPSSTGSAPFLSLCVYHHAFKSSAEYAQSRAGIASISTAVVGGSGKDVSIFRCQR